MLNSANELPSQITKVRETDENEPVTEILDEANLIQRKDRLIVLLRYGVSPVRFLSLGIPLLIMTLTMLFVLPDGLFYSILPESFRHFYSPITIRLLAWSLILVIFASFWLFRFILPAKNFKKELIEIEEQIQHLRLSTFAGKKNAYEGELRKLTNLSAKAFFENQERALQAAQLRKEARNKLGHKLPDFGEVQYCIDSLNELIAREKKEQQNQRNWRSFAIGIMFTYIVGLVVSAIAMNQYGTNMSVAAFGIPVSVVLWGGAGSLAAILYRFYQEKGLVKFDVEVRWLIARPIIGIIMGAVVYLSLVSGLILLGASPSTAAQAADAPVPAGRLEVYWIIAFLAGFSDKFYVGIINLLVAKTGLAGTDTELDGKPATIADAQSKSA